MATSAPAWLKDLQPIEQEPSLRYYLHKHLSQPRPARSLWTIHASDIVDEQEDWCPRRVALMLRDEVTPAPEDLATVNSVVFRHSADVAVALIDWLADAGIAIGNWRCQRCTRLTLFRLRPKTCPWCDGMKLDYEELRVTSQISGISGGIDVMVRFPGQKLAEVVEIKGVQKTDFLDLKMALGKHRLRTNMYLRLIEESAFTHKAEINTQKARIIYIVKGGWGIKSDDMAAWGFHDSAWTPFKEFTISRDDSQTDVFSEIAKPLWGWVQRLMKGEVTQPPSGICATATCARAKHCEVVKTCFNEPWGD